MHWNELSEGEREKDRDAVRRLPQLLGVTAGQPPAQPVARASSPDVQA
ncbi:hypothetical protein [Diaphorobacter aerolatus]|uniref:Uncharacterized protein n=1 Tax=Diaphorobacter aerolatus TaxID=1288495 RepID=A0A7H0GG18_9BURK|nr:hypothetical protein [Diaphorobacter aerolatus]QNP47234.1 hypothetical protein H9K75_12665 [Diaphorobacter aerolatus]